MTEKSSKVGQAELSVPGGRWGVISRSVHTRLQVSVRNG